MKVIGLIIKPRWKKFSCTCNKELSLCSICRYEIAENSIPSKDFTVKEIEIKNGKLTGKTISRKINQVKLVNDVNDGCIGWGF